MLLHYPVPRVVRLAKENTLQKTVKHNFGIQTHFDYYIHIALFTTETTPIKKTRTHSWPTIFKTISQISNGF